MIDEVELFRLLPAVCFHFSWASNVTQSYPSATIIAAEYNSHFGGHDQLLYQRLQPIAERRN